MNALLTDLYELTMAAGFFEAGKTQEKATFELSIRRLPKDRNYVVVAGLAQVVEYLLNLRFREEEIAYLRRLPQFARASEGFWDYLRGFRFTGDLFAGEPILFLRAPIIQAQIPETYLLSALTFQTLIASKAARMAGAAGGRPVVEFGTRRAHTPEAGVLAGRAAYLGGCAGTSNTLAGFRYGIPVMGTAAHSWVMSFAGEAEAFRQLQRVLGEHTIQLLDTYDAIQGAQTAAELGPPLKAVRLDSGDFLSLSRRVRAILNETGLRQTGIMLSGDLDEYRIRDLLAAGAPVDSFGVGTQLATSADAPHMSAIYKMVEIDIHGIKRYTAKYSNEKCSLPGTKQIFRMEDRDILARSGECDRGEALLRPVIAEGRLLAPLATVEQARERAAASIARLPARLRQLEVAEPWPVEQSEELARLVEQTRRNLARMA
jgi:nicotinate phosphoribosyltransferase